MRHWVASTIRDHWSRRGPDFGVNFAVVGLTVAAVVVASVPSTPQPDAQFDYQIGADYTPADGVTVVSRDWFAGEPLTTAGGGGYSICYINAFQTQPDEDGVDRPDERANWPSELVLSEFGDDPNWDGEYLVDLSTVSRRYLATQHVATMIDTCAAKGFDAVEFDNLDSWTRFAVPFDQDEAVAYAAALTGYAHSVGLAAGQKNTPELGAEVSLDAIGFDFAIAEECGRFDECEAYTDVFGDDVIAIEYSADGFAAACAAIGDQVAVVRRDIEVTTPDSPTYVYDSC